MQVFYTNANFRAGVTDQNDRCHPFVWTKTSMEILENPTAQPFQRQPTSTSVFCAPARRRPAPAIASTQSTGPISGSTVVTQLSSSTFAVPGVCSVVVPGVLGWLGVQGGFEGVPRELVGQPARADQARDLFLGAGEQPFDDSCSSIIDSVIAVVDSDTAVSFPIRPDPHTPFSRRPAPG